MDVDIVWYGIVECLSTVLVRWYATWSSKGYWSRSFGCTTDAVRGVRGLFWRGEWVRIGTVT